MCGLIWLNEEDTNGSIWYVVMITWNKIPFGILYTF